LYLTIVTDGPDAPGALRRYVLTDAQILWLIQADEPALTELFGQLP